MREHDLTFDFSLSTNNVHFFSCTFVVPCKFLLSLLLLKFDVLLLLPLLLLLYHQIWNPNQLKSVSVFRLTFRVAVLLLVGARDGLPPAAVLLPDRGRDAVARDGGGAAGSSLPERVRVVRRAVVAWCGKKRFFVFEKVHFPIIFLAPPQSYYFCTLVGTNRN